MGIFRNTIGCTSSSSPYIITPSDYDKYLIATVSFGSSGQFELPSVGTSSTVDLGVGDTVVIADSYGYISGNGPSLIRSGLDNGVMVRVNGVDVSSLYYPFNLSNMPLLFRIIFAKDVFALLRSFIFTVISEYI